MTPTKSDVAALREIVDVSRETLDRLTRYAEALARWQKTTNLVSPATIQHFWTRHVLDSAQLLSFAGQGTSWADLGTGAGLPGFVLAILGAGSGRASRVVLVESSGRKAAFLHQARVATATSVEITASRIESETTQRRIAHIDIVTARALAPLSQLFRYTEHAAANGSRLLFPKGRSVDTEIEEARQQWAFDVVRHASRIDPESCILEITSLARRDMERR
ncbi:MAG: 16S rRNA (guanine(527)-N(7))-methyltransferase RsmG [Pseudomonadota bacterium]